MFYRLLIVLVAGLFPAADVIGNDQATRNPYPNEPEGFVPWFSHDWQSWPAEHGQQMPASEAGMIRQGRTAGNFELVDDPDAPHGKGRSLRHRQAQGQRTGTTSGTFDLFHPRPDAGDSRRQEDQVSLSSVYRSHWVLIEPDPETGDWQFGSTHMRTFWWNRYYGRGQGNISIASPDHPATASNRHDYFRGARFWFYPTDGGGSRGVFADPDGRYELGVWHHLEYLWEPEGNFGRGEPGMNNSRVRIWINGDLKYDDRVSQHVRAPLANEHFAMVWLGGNSLPTRYPQGDISPGGWTDQAGESRELYRSIGADSAGDETYVQSPLNPNGAAYVAELELPDGRPHHLPDAHRTTATYRYAKDADGGQPIDLTVELLEQWEGEGQWNVIRTATHTDIGNNVTEGTLSTPTRNPELPPGTYALRFTASGGDGDARRARVTSAQWRTTHTNTRTQDDFLRFGDIYISGALYEEE